MGGELVTGSDKQERQLGCRFWDPTSQRCAVGVMTHCHFTLQFFLIFLYSESKWKLLFLLQVTRLTPSLNSYNRQLSKAHTKGANLEA